MVDDSGAARVARGVVVDLGVVENGIAAVGDAAGGNGRTLIVTSFSDRFPPGPSTSNTRTEFVPSIVAPFPFTLIRDVTTGSPFSPLSGVVRA